MQQGSLFLGLVCFLPGFFLHAAGFIKRCDPQLVAGAAAPRTFQDPSKVRFPWGCGGDGWLSPRSPPSELVTRVALLDVALTCVYLACWVGSWDPPPPPNQGKTPVSTESEDWAMHTW